MASNVVEYFTSCFKIFYFAYTISLKGFGVTHTQCLFMCKILFNCCYQECPNKMIFLNTLPQTHCSGTTPPSTIASCFVLFVCCCLLPTLNVLINYGCMQNSVKYAEKFFFLVTCVYITLYAKLWSSG